MPKSRLLILGAIVIIAYSVLHALWVAQYPPMRNDDHFNSFGAVLTQLNDPRLYPDDPVWSDTTFADSHGFLFIALLRLGENLFGTVWDAWWFFTLLCVLVYIPGFFLFLHELTQDKMIAFVLAIGSTMPIYLYVTFANWGIISVYAHVFVTATAGWCLWGFVHLLKRDAAAWGWGVFALVVGLTIYLNPVNGGGLLGILALLLLVERVGWWRWFAFMVGTAAAMLPYVVNYAGSLTSGEPPSPEAVDAANDFMLQLAGRRLFPWTLNPTAAPILIVGVALSGIVALILFYIKQNDFPNRPLLLALVLVQLAPGYLLTGHPVFLLALAYWWFRREPDRWDRLMLVMVIAVNLIAPVTSAASHYIWLDGGISPVFTLTYEPIRLLRWVMVPVYVLIARWMARLTAEEGSDPLNWMAAACMVAVIFSIFGANNPVKDDSVFMKTLLPMRWGLALFVIGLVWLKSRFQADVPPLFVQLAWIGFALLGLGFVGGMMPLEAVSTQGILILAVLLIAFGAMNYETRITYPKLGLAAFFIGTFMLPIAGYHKIKPDLNWCDPPNLTDCANGDDVIDAADWIHAETPIDAQLYVIGLQPERFQPLARRSTLHVNHYQIFWFQGAEALLGALDTAEKIAYLNPLRDGYIGDEALVQTLQAFDTDYVVVIGKGYAFDLPVVYENDSAVVYALDKDGS